MKFPSRKALLVALSLAIPLAQASDTDSSSCNTLKAFGVLSATVTAFMARKAAYNRYCRLQNEQAVRERYDALLLKADPFTEEEDERFDEISKKYNHKKPRELANFLRNNSIEAINKARLPPAYITELEDLAKKLQVPGSFQKSHELFYEQVEDLRETICRLELEKLSWFTLKYKGAWLPRLHAFLSWR